MVAHHIYGRGSAFRPFSFAGSESPGRVTTLHICSVQHSRFHCSDMHRHGTRTLSQFVLFDSNTMFFFCVNPAVKMDVAPLSYFGSDCYPPPPVIGQRGEGDKPHGVWISRMIRGRGAPYLVLRSSLEDIYVCSWPKRGSGGT